MTKEQALNNKQKVQTDVRHAWINNNYLGTAELATGSGKSKIALDCLGILRQDNSSLKALFVTPTESMRDIDWPDEAAKWGVSLENVKLVCQASVMKQKLEKYDLIVLDEYHNCTVPFLKKLIEYRDEHKGKILALTATLPDKVKWPEEEERINLLRSTVPSIYKLTTDEAVDLGLIADFEVQVLRFRFDTTNKNIKAGGSKTSWDTTEGAHYVYLTKELQKAMFSKNQGLKFMKMGQRTNFIYDLPSKYRLAKSCLEKLKDRGRTLAMCGSIKQANLLFGDHVYHSNSSQEYLDKFQAGEIPQLGSVKALDEGKNLYKLDNLLIQQVQSTDRRLIQRFGRVLRMDYDNMNRKALIIILVAVCADGQTLSCDEKWLNEAIKGFDSKRISYHNVKVPD